MTGEDGSMVTHNVVDGKEVTRYDKEELKYCIHDSSGSSTFNSLTTSKFFFLEELLRLSSLY